MSWRPSDKSG
ncbi:hypothetical protein AYI68_g6111, partial [Smittium mucronatum]